MWKMVSNVFKLESWNDLCRAMLKSRGTIRYWLLLFGIVHLILIVSLTKVIKTGSLTKLVEGTERFHGIVKFYLGYAIDGGFWNKSDLIKKKSFSQHLALVCYIELLTMNYSIYTHT